MGLAVEEAVVEVLPSCYYPPEVSRFLSQTTAAVEPGGSDTLS